MSPIGKILLVSNKGKFMSPIREILLVSNKGKFTSLQQGELY